MANDAARVPWRQWQRLLRDGDDGSDIATAIAAIRAFFHDDRMCTGTDAVGVLWRARHLCHDDTTAIGAEAQWALLLLLVTAVSRSETALACQLLRGSRADAVRDLLLLVRVADADSNDDPAQREEDEGDQRRASLRAVATRALWTALMDVANALQAVDSEASLCRASGESERDDTAVDATDGEEETDEEDGKLTWDAFMALPSTLDACALHKTKHGRAVLQHVEEIVAVQQSRLETLQPSLSTASASASASAPAPTSASASAASATPLFERQLEEATQRLVKCLERSVAEPCDTVSAMTNVTVSDTAFGTCPDDASVVVYVRRHGNDSDTSTVSISVDAVPQPRVDPAWENDSDPGETVDAIVAELHALDTLRPLSVRVAVLLSQQQRQGVALVRRVDETTARAWEHAIRKALNARTHGTGGSAEDDEAAMRTLLRYAALDPTAVLDAVVTSVVATSLHHTFTVQLFSWCPALVRWRDPRDTRATHSSQLVVALTRELTRVVVTPTAGTASAVEDAPAFQFMMALSTPTGLLAPDVVVDDVLWSVLKEICSTVDPTPVTRLLELALRFFTALLGDRTRRCSTTLLASTFRVVGGQYRRFYVSATASDTRVTDFRDVALLLSCTILRLARASSATAALVDWSCDLATETLFEVYGVRPLVPPPVAVAADDAWHDTLTTSIQRDLWSLVWHMDDATDETSMAVVSRLAAVQTRSFVSPCGTTTIAGASLVQIHVATMLSVSGVRGLERILTMVERRLLPLPRPSQRAATPVEVMDYAVRCWCLFAFAHGTGEEDEAAAVTPRDIMLRMLEHTLRPMDRAIESAADDAADLLHCLRVIGVVHAWLLTATASEEERDGCDVRGALLQRVDVAALRVLFLLAQRPPSDDGDDVASSREAVAVVLGSCRLLESETVRRFLRTTVASSTRS